MHKWSDSPIVSFTRNGETLTLGRGPEDPVLHIYGSTGLGLAPVSIASTERLTGDGNLVRGVRYDSREVYIPVHASAPSSGDLSRWRRELTRLLAPHRGMVDVRIEDPTTGTDRMIRGYYREGLEGDFGTDFHGDWQNLGLTFECPDPWWLGPEHITTLRLNPGTKPFLSEGRIFRRNLVPNPLGPGADDAELWQADNGELTYATVDGEPAVAFMKDAAEALGYITPAAEFRPPAESTVHFSAEVKVGTDLDMRLRIAASGGADPSTEEDSPDEVPVVAQAPADGWVRHDILAPVSVVPEDGYCQTLIEPTNMDVGDQFWVRNVLVEVNTTGDYFDGDSPDCKWVGCENGVESVMWDPTETTPFFPVILAQSVVSGEFSVTISGEGRVFPTWEIVGPGTDLRIVRGTDRIAIDGDVKPGETLLIDTAAGRIVPDRWDDVSLDSTLFQLEPGTQTITVTMVGATTETEVRMKYRERHLEAV